VNLFTVEEVQDLCCLKASAIPDICSSIQLKMRERLVDLLSILKRPKHEKFVAGIFTQIRPVWIGELETIGQELRKVNGWGQSCE
jgi:hypothetical protein